jgi:hypothetical protein
MSAGWIVLALFVILFLWAGWALRKRTPPSSGPEATADRHRRTDGYSHGGT